MEGGPRNESIILQLDSESRFRDALAREEEEVKGGEGLVAQPQTRKRKKKIFWSGHCQAPVSSTLGSILLFETESRSI